MKFSQKLARLEMFNVRVVIQTFGTEKQFKALTKKHKVWDGKSNWSVDNGDGENVQGTTYRFTGGHSAIWIQRASSLADWRDTATHELVHAMAHAMTTKGMEISHGGVHGPAGIDEVLAYGLCHLATQAGVFK